jgi:hypothetical protein
MNADQVSCSFPSSRGNITCLWYTVGGKISEKYLEQIGESARKTLALLAPAYGDNMKKLSVFEFHDPRNGIKRQRADASVNRVQTLVSSDGR